MHKAMIANDLYLIRSVRGVLRINGVQVESHIDHGDKTITVADEGGSRLELVARGVRAGLEAVGASSLCPVWGGDVETLPDQEPRPIRFNPDGLS